MTVSVSATPVSIAMALAIVDEARAKDYSTGVIGLRGAPERALDVEVQHEGQLVRVRAAESALAMREVLAERDGADWLVVVTDRDDEDLGAGLLAHLVWQRLRSPDPWEAVRHRFAASGIDPALTQVPDSRELATGLLAAAPPGGWPAAPAGILTRNHAFSAVATAHLDLESEAIDVLAVLRWTMRPGSVAAVATLRESMGDRLVDETLAWIARQAGSAAEPVLALLRQGDLTDVVPMGIVAELLTADLSGRPSDEPGQSSGGRPPGEPARHTSAGRPPGEPAGHTSAGRPSGGWPLGELARHTSAGRPSGEPGHPFAGGPSGGWPSGGRPSGEPAGHTSAGRPSGDGHPGIEHQAQLALARLEPRWGEPRPGLRAIHALGTVTASLVGDLVNDRRWSDAVHRALRRGDEIVTQVQAGGLSLRSDLLPSGLRARLIVLAEALRRAATADPTSPAWAAVDTAWETVERHALAATDPAPLRPLQAAVRLARWLSTVEEVRAGGPVDVTALARHHLEHGAWVDAAINDAFEGVDDEAVSAGLRAVLDAARSRRHREERAFAACLARDAADEAPVPSGSDADPKDAPVLLLENLLPDVVIPMARKAPLLLLVMDGMSAATATEVVADATSRHGWLEAAVPGTTSPHRAAALSVLPSLTEMSRTSLLCGRLVQGQQAAERTGYEQLTSAAGKIRAVLFHKKDVDTRMPGWAISDDVGRALSDHDTRLVTVVLNTIDDALDRSDPAGTTWTADAVKHLSPLLARARAAGRTVVVTADHGHIVERRLGTQRSYRDISSGRSRAVTGAIEEGEIEVAGARVLTGDHRAVLAVDEGLRYAPLKAGYHGGASAAEVVVPVVVLVPDVEVNPLDLPLLPPQMPTWWLAREPGPTASAAAPSSAAGPPLPRGRKAPRPDLGPTLFDDLDAPGATSAPVNPGAAGSAAAWGAPGSPGTRAAPGASAVPAGRGTGRDVVASDVFAAQRRLTGRLIVTDEQVGRLIDALVAGEGRLPETLAARALGLNEARLRGALAQVQQLLNVEGYAVVGADAGARVVTLDQQLLREQFELR